MACGELLALLAFADGDLVFTPLALLAALALIARGLVMAFVATVGPVMMVATVAVAVPVLVTVVVGEGDSEAMGSLIALLAEGELAAPQSAEPAVRAGRVGGGGAGESLVGPGIVLGLGEALRLCDDHLLEARDLLLAFGEVGAGCVGGIGGALCGLGGGIGGGEEVLEARVVAQLAVELRDEILVGQGNGIELRCRLGDLLVIVDDVRLEAFQLVLG